MRRLFIHSFCFCLALSGWTVPVARAQWAVVDAPAIVQLIKEVQGMEQQLAIARNQLLQAEQALQSTRGARGMEQLLSGTNRNYLPPNWSQVNASLQGPSRYSMLGADAQSIISTNAVLPPQRLATLSPSRQQLIRDEREWSAMQQALSHEALANASDRFASLEALVGAITTAADQKAILDLQARMLAELAMLLNEQTKLQLLGQSVIAQQAGLDLKVREQALADSGRFETRFQPQP